MCPLFGSSKYDNTSHIASDNFFRNVHHCGTGGSMRVCHAAGPGLIPGRDNFPG